MTNTSQALNDKELECLAVLWASERPLQSSDVHVAIIEQRRKADTTADVPPFTTVATWLQKMAKRGLVEVTTTDSSPVKSKSPRTAYRALPPEVVLRQGLKPIAQSCPKGKRQELLKIFKEELGLK